MPAWWGKKSSKSKEDGHQTQLDTHTPHAHQSKFTSFSGKSDGYSKRRAADKDKPRSFDEALISRNSPRCSREFGAGGSSGFSGFDSDSAHPLPRPSISSMQSDLAVGLGSGSASVSSVSSSGSSEDHVIGNDQGPLIGYRSRVDPRVNGEIKLNTTGSRSPVPGSRSPVTASRGATSPTSPLHPRLSGTSVDSPTGRPEDGKCQAHKLPLPPGSPSSPSALPSSPTCLTKWRKGRLLGRGTFGHVYLGFNSESGQMCAIKEVRVDSEDNGLKESLKQLNQEINLLSQLSQPNIVRYYGSELGDEALSVYLEYVSGGSIHKLLQEYGPFREPVIQNYTRQILSGLAYLHGRNTVHRDIKGANILVDPNGEIKLADFGMAKHITAYSSMLSFKGSPYWMAPEVVMNTNGYSLAVDIWSLGCTILEMAAAKPPWSQYEGVAAIFKIGNSKDMPEIPDHLSNESKNFIRLCLQRDPSARPSAAQLLEHPFLRDQATTRVANANLTRDAFPFAFDGSRTPPALELHSGRQTMSTTDGDYAVRTLPALSRTSRNARDSVRTITSLPVSPCSSPLRNGVTQRTGFLSPPHPAYPLVGPAQNGYNISDYPVYPIRQNMRYPPYDPLIETSPLRSQTPGTSPCRPI